jgi:hypothetical protein
MCEKHPRKKTIYVLDSKRVDHPASSVPVVMPASLTATGAMPASMQRRAATPEKTAVGKSANWIAKSLQGNPKLIRKS